MQEKYIKLGNKDVFNDQYLLAVFEVYTYGADLLDAASEIAAESSNGSNITVGTATPFSDSMGAIVYKVDKKKNLVWIAYPWRMFDRGGNVQNILTFIIGNVMGMADLAGCKLQDVWFPNSMLDQYDGPSYTLDDMRSYLDAYNTPILGTIVKPKIGLTASEYAEVCHDFWSGGGMFVKNDEPQADQDFCPFDKMVDYVREAMDTAERETNQKKIHSFNVSAADFKTMIERAEYIKNKMKPGSYAYLIDGITAGWTAVQTLRRKYPNVFLHFHRAGHGAFTRPENPFGMSVPVLTKFARLAGTSGIHTGTAGVGKMAGNDIDDITAAKLALLYEYDGFFFEQDWLKFPKNDTDANKFIEDKNPGEWEKNKELEQMNKFYSNLVSKRKPGLFAQNWRKIKTTCPIISGGLNPVLLKPFIDKIQDVDFITTMGAGVHSHPSGTKAGARAVVQACEAWQKKVDIYEYAKNHRELDEAIAFYNKRGTQAKKVSSEKGENE
jgi:ribulose-bisphosphate carboxylase large chain